MKNAIIGMVVGGLALVVGYLFQADPYKISELGHAHDQAVLQHRDSSYTHITWVTSDGANYAQLRFFDRVEGGVCLRPTWDDYAALNQRLVDAGQPASLSHLVAPSQRPHGEAPDRSWPEGMPHPDPGTLSNTAYVTLYPAATMLAVDANGQPVTAPRVLIVGLGSGIGAAVLMHHYPDAHITFVDIDQVVIDAVLDHYPLMKHLTDTGRIDMVAADARQYLREAAIDPDTAPFDVVVLDAYTAGSTIPPHLMTREFYDQVAAAMTPGGVCLSNIIGSYTGTQRDVLGGAIRSMLDSSQNGGEGFSHVFNLPVVRPVNDQFDPKRPRNNVVLSARQPLTPTARPQAWEAMRRFRPYADLGLVQQPGEWATYEIVGISGDTWATCGLSFAANDALPELAPVIAALKGRHGAPAPAQRDPLVVPDDRFPGDEFRDRYHSPIHGRTWYELEVLRGGEATAMWGQLQSVLEAYRQQGQTLVGWDRQPDAFRIQYTDWLGHAQLVWARSLATAVAPAGATGYVHDGAFLTREGGEMGDTPLFTDQTPNADIYNL